MLDPEPGVPLTTMGWVARANALTEATAQDERPH
jgi:hypothetical protein